MDLIPPTRQPREGSSASLNGMTHAQVLLREYARATNMLIAGRPFVTSDPELTSLLEAFGAQVAPHPSREGSLGLETVFDLSDQARPHPGAITVLAPGGSFQGVYAPDTSLLRGPADPERIDRSRGGPHRPPAPRSPDWPRPGFGT